MKICCIDYLYASELERLGHQVFRLDLKPGLIDLEGLPELAEADLLIQQERLAPRVILQGLEKVPCRTVFISLDTHLNLFWHKYYARLFDLTLTAHLSFFAAQPDAPRENLRRLRHYGAERPWREHGARSHEVSFCGVVDKHRPMRRALLDLVGTYFPLYHPAEYLSWSKMLELFADTRLLPNESIGEEVNFRLFEGASCGCLVFSQNIGEDQNVCFEPDKEIITYDHGLELLEKLTFYRASPRAAEKLAKAAWLRVHREHLPRQRAAEMIDLATGSGASEPGGRARGAEAAKYYTLTMLQLSRHGSLVLPVGRLLKQLMEIEADGDLAAATLQLLAEAALPDSPLYKAGAEAEFAAMGLYFCRKIMKERLFGASLACNLAASVYARLQGDFFLAAQFWDRQKEAQLSIGQPVPDWEFPAEPLPDDAWGRDGRFYLFWAEVLEGRGYLARPGYNFRMEPGFMPESALECLLLVQAGANETAMSLAERATLATCQARVAGRVKGCAYLHLGFLAQGSLFDQKNWKAQQAYGLGLLKCLKLEPGLDELTEARQKCQLAGLEGDFWRQLEQSPASDYIARILKSDG